MNEKPQFIYGKEFWYVSAFINPQFINCKEKIAEIVRIFQEKFKNLTADDLEKIKWNKERMEKVIELGKNVAIQGEWMPFIDSFPYYDENTGFNYSMLGSLQFEVEYFKDNPEKKATIEPAIIQQIPAIGLDLLKNLGKQAANKYLLIDLESPVYVFVFSNKMTGKTVQWSEENINQYKRILGDWTEIYSGQWPDYTEELYTRRVQQNLSNRLSELHFIRRNSGFIYMAEENYRKFFDYMKKFVLEPTARVRAMLFALMAINQALDMLFIRQQSEFFMDLETIEKKIKNLRYLRGMIQTEMSSIYNELDYNRRQHYTSVLIHLIEEFNIDTTLNRLNHKYDVIYDSMQVLYQKKNEENQAKVGRGMAFLNILFGLGVLADFAAVTVAVMEGLSAGNLFAAILNGTISLVILVILLGTTFVFLKIRMESRKEKASRTVDAVIFDGKGKVVLIKRKNPPFKGQPALPGGFIEPKESPEEAVVREAKEETGLDVKIEKWIGIYDDKDRDPRGRVISTAFLCSIKENSSCMKAGDDAAGAMLVPLEQLKGANLAFDHEKILQDAIKKNE
ncbi:MAG: NUDIX hydrolase [Candidatus Helarchaeota archaeon]|nr:NUDIX hydrolase [Candidatus Helarchaeota archaeon]